MKFPIYKWKKKNHGSKPPTRLIILGITRLYMANPFNSSIVDDLLQQDTLWWTNIAMENGYLVRVFSH